MTPGGVVVRIGLVLFTAPSNSPCAVRALQALRDDTDTPPLLAFQAWHWHAQATPWSQSGHDANCQHQHGQAASMRSWPGTNCGKLSYSNPLTYSTTSLQLW